MPKIFSTKQIDHAWHLVHDHHMNIEQIADIMDCSLLNARLLHGTAIKRFGKPYARYLNAKEKKVKIERPEAVYSNHSPLGFAS